MLILDTDIVQVKECRIYPCGVLALTFFLCHFQLFSDDSLMDVLSG